MIHINARWGVNPILQASMVYLYGAYKKTKKQCSTAAASTAGEIERKFVFFTIDLPQASSLNKFRKFVFLPVF